MNTYKKKVKSYSMSFSRYGLLKFGRDFFRSRASREKWFLGNNFRLWKLIIQSLYQVERAQIWYSSLLLAKCYESALKLNVSPLFLVMVTQIRHFIQPKMSLWSLWNKPITPMHSLGHKTPTMIVGYHSKICVVSAPEIQGHGGRQYRLANGDIKTIQAKLQAFIK